MWIGQEKKKKLFYIIPHDPIDECFDPWQYVFPPYVSILCTQDKFLLILFPRKQPVIE